ncbi:MAG TPA: hypothetical protein VGQ17_11230 [Gemmatimonadales bacterium]|nr:hypothetical protein [Gemmatimonadales bacterium]
MTSKRGFVLPMIIFALAVMGVLLLAIMRTTDDDRMGSRYALEGTRSFYAADAGLNQMVAEWADSDYTSDIPTTGNISDRGWRNLPGKAGKYRGVLRRLSTALIELTVDGRSGAAGGGLRTVQVLLEGKSTSVFKYAAFGVTSMTMSAGPTTDSFNSDSGSYAATKCTTNCNGDLATNGSVTLSGGLAKDSVFYGTTKSGCTSARVTSGDCTPIPQPLSAPTIPCPASPSPFSPTTDLTPTSGTGYTPATGVLDVNGSVTLNTALTKVFKFKDLTLKAGDALIIPAATVGHVDIYLTGKLTQLGGSINNLTQKPTNLTIWGCGSDATTWEFKAAGTTSYFAVYAPNHPITISAGGALYGAFVGATISLSGGTQIHYDDALGTGSGTVIAFIPGSWTEITR